MGYGVMPQWLVDAVNKLMVNSNSCTASFTQRAGIAALNGPQDDVNRDGGGVPAAARRILRGPEHAAGFPLRDSGRRILRVSQYHRHRLRSNALADALLQKAGVACLSGTAFGDYGEGYLRFSIANSYEKLMDAVERIRKFLTP